MINSFIVSLVLMFFWGGLYIVLNRKLYTSKLYFYLLFLMGSAGIVLPLDKFVHYYTQNYNVGVILLFAFLLVFSLIPWFYFDSKLKRWGRICIKGKYVNVLKYIFIVNIILGLYSILYALPYAKLALEMGGDEVRHFIQDETLYPQNIFTTICVGIGFLTPIQILLFYLSLLDKKLWKFSLLLFLSSLSYIITSLPYMARDGFIFIPLTYFFLYKVFSKSLDEKIKHKIKRYATIIGSLVLSMFLLITVQRFFDNAKYGLSQTDSLIFGTWGYFFQQPYVFEQTIEYSTDFEGFSRRFELIENILGLPKNEFEITTLNTAFGTMYTDFYKAFGWNSLICFSLFYVISFRGLLAFLTKFQNHFSILLVFTIYIYYTISGLFYYKMFLISVTKLYLFVLCASLFMVNMLYLERKNV